MSVSRERQQAPPERARVAPRRRLGAPSRVVDVDGARAQTTEALLGSLADRLGLRADSIRVRVDGEAASRTRPRGVRGVLAGGTIWLDPAQYDPRRADGRALLAHEAAHSAQRAELRQRPDRRRPSLAAAEREAAAFAEAVREGRTPRRPVATLPAGAEAADTGATVAPAAPATAPQPASPATDPLVTYRTWRSELDALVDQVRRVYPRQLGDMRDNLDGWWVSDGDVDRAMEILEALPVEDAAALVRALGSRLRVRLVDNVSGSHRRNFRRSVLGSYAALTPGELARFDEDLFGNLSLVQLGEQERFLAVVVLLGLRSEARRALVTGSRGGEFRELMTGRAPDPVRRLAELRQRTADLRRRRVAEQRIADDPRTATLLATLQRLLRDPTAADARAALRQLAPLVPGSAPAPTPVAPGGGGSAGATPADRAENAAPGTADQPSTTPAQTEPQEPAELTVILERLEQTGAVNRLLRSLSDRDRYSPGPLRDAYLAVLRARPVDANVRLAISLLDTGIWDWWVSDAEARLAYDVVSSLSLDARDRFFRRDDGAWLHRLESNLPEDVLGRADFAGLSVVRDEHGQLVDAGARQAQALRGGGSQVLARILRLIETLPAPPGAKRVFDEILAIPNPLVREAVVGRLDLLGKLGPVLERLPDDVLFSEDRRLDLMTVMAARDPRHLERHIRGVLSTGFFQLDWAVTSREAFLAFQMLRALSPADRERFGQLDFIVGELSADMRASAGLHMLNARSAAAQRDAVRTRLHDERLWTAGHASELRSLVQILVALGDRRWVFDRSRVTRAWEVEALRPLVTRFRLYDERRGRTRYQPERVQEAGFWDDYGVFSVLKIMGSALWIVVRDGFRGRIYVNPFTRELGHTGFALNDAQDMLGGDVTGVRFRDPDAASDDDERAASSAQRGGGGQTVATNEVAINWNQRLGVLTVDLPAVELDSIGIVGIAGSAHTGRVSARGISVQARFQTDDLAQPPSADLGIVDLELDDVLLGGADFTAASRVHLGRLRVHASSGQVPVEPPRPASSSLLPIPVFGPVIELVRFLIEAGRTAGSAGAQLGTLRGLQLELGSFEVEGLTLGADRQIASISVAGLRAAWGGTRAEYLRALVATFDRRIAAATDATEQAELRAQQAAARRELRELVPNEARLLQLMRRAALDPESLTPADHAEMLALQGSGRGGAILDVGTITLRGIGGTVTAREVTIDRLRGQGTSEALTLGLLTDEALLRRFTAEGPPREGDTEQRDRSDLELEARTMTAVDVAVEAEIPSTATLEGERKQLVGESVRLGSAHEDELRRRVDARIERLEALIILRTELDELEQLGTRANRQQVSRRRELHTLLARRFGVRVGRAELRGVALNADVESGTYGLGVAGVQVDQIESDAFGIRRLTGTNLRGAFQLVPGIAGVRGLPGTLQRVRGPTPPGETEPTPGFGADELHAEGVRAGAVGAAVGAIDLHGLEGSAERVPDGWRIRDLKIRSLSVNGIDYGTSEKRIRSIRPLTITGITANLTVTSAGEGSQRSTSYAIERVDIDSISVAGAPATAAPSSGASPTTPATEPALSYEDRVSGLRGELYSGALRGVWVAGLTIRQSDAGTTLERPVDTPVAGLRQFDALRFATAFGESFSLGGVLSSPQGAAQDAFGVQFATDGSSVFDLRDLALSDATLTTPSGSIRIERLPMSGRVRYRSQGEISDIGLEGFTVPELVLGRVDWRMEDGATVAARGRTVLEGIRATAGLRTDAAGLSDFSIARLRIDRIAAEDLRYRKDPLDIHIDRPSSTGTPPLDVRDVLIEGLRWDREHGVTSGIVGVGSADVGLEARFAADMRATGSLRARTISVRFEPGNRLTARAERVDADADLTLGTTTAALAVRGLDTGGIEVSPDRIRVGAGSQPHLNLGTTGRIHVKSFHFADTSSLVWIDVFDRTNRGIDLRELDAALTIDLNSPGTTPRIRRLTIDELSLGLLEAADVSIRDAFKGQLTLTGAESKARLEAVHVLELAVEPTAAGGWTMAGYRELHVDQLALENVEVAVEIGRIMRSRPAPPPPAPGAAAPAFDPRTLTPFREVFNSLDGHINMDVVLPIYWNDIRVDNIQQDAFSIRLAIERGRVDYEVIENEAFGALADSVMDFEVEDGRLILEFDPRAVATAAGAAAGAAAGGSRFGPVGAGIGAVGGGIGGLVLGSRAQTEVLRWDLTEIDLERAPSISFFTLTQYQFPPSSGGDDEPSSVTVDSANAQLKNIDIALELVNENSLAITLPGGLGTVTLAPFALRGLTVRGNLPGRVGAPLRLGVESLSVEAVELDLGGLGRFTSSALLLRGLTRAQLAFVAFKPERFYGLVRTLAWSNLTLTGTPAAALSPATSSPAGGTP